LAGVEITESQYQRIADCLPRQRGNVSMTNLQLLNALLYVAEHGCKWRGLPRHFGNWHTVYTRMNRWSKAGVLDRIFARLAWWDYDRVVYRRRNEIERLFRRLKGYRRVFCRFDKLDVLFTGFIVFTLIVEALRFSVNRP
jgi:transposase